MTTKQSLIERASLLATIGKTVLPLACAASASAATLNFDFFGAGLYDNSGFFASTLWIPTVGGGQNQGTGFKLYGSETVNDSIFYRYDEGFGGTRPVFDGDGIALLWGGSISGFLNAGDVLSAPYDIQYAFTHTPAAPGDTYISNSWRLTIGLLDWSSKASVNWLDDGSQLSALTRNEVTGGESDAGSYSYSGNLDLTVQNDHVEFNTPTHWYVLYEVLVNHENDYHNFANWGINPRLNGDTLTVSVPQNSIDLAYTAIPEVSTVSLAAAGLLLAARRRRTS